MKEFLVEEGREEVGGGGGWRGGGRVPYKKARRKIGMRPLRETYPNTQISFSREYNGAHKLTYKEHECPTSKHHFFRLAANTVIIF